MVHARLWPATPQHPRLAFSFEVLDWAEALLLECQVALKDFCKAMEFKCPHLVAKVIYTNEALARITNASNYYIFLLRWPSWVLLVPVNFVLSFVFSLLLIN